MNGSIASFGISLSVIVFWLTTKIVYSKVWIKSNTTINVEDYLKIEFVDKYLIPNMAVLTSKLHALEQVNFGYEIQKRYIEYYRFVETGTRNTGLLYRPYLKRGESGQVQIVKGDAAVARDVYMQACNKFLAFFLS